MLFARRVRERVEWPGSGSSFANPWPKCLRNSQPWCSEHRDAAASHCIPAVHTYARARTCTRRIIEMRCSWPSPRFIPFPLSPFTLLCLLCCRFLSLSLSPLPHRSKRASLIMRKTDSTPDQRILSAFDCQVKRLKMDMEIPPGGRFNGSPYIIPRIPGEYPWQYTISSHRSGKTSIKRRTRAIDNAININVISLNWYLNINDMNDIRIL